MLDFHTILQYSDINTPVKYQALNTTLKYCEISTNLKYQACRELLNTRLLRQYYKNNPFNTFSFSTIQQVTFQKHLGQRSTLGETFPYLCMHEITDTHYWLV